MTFTHVRLTAVATVLAACAWAFPAQANPWNERTILTFSEAVMVPGATLQPGKYVFELADRHVVRIRKDDGGEVVTTTMAVPVQRAEATNEIVIRFNPTDRGVPPAIKSWFYPGSVYGHEFAYPETQARDLAQRTKTLVLSADVAGSDAQSGQLRTYDPKGLMAEWRGDPATMREWEAWQRTRTPSSAGSNTRRQSSAAIIEGDFQGMRVKLNELEANPTKYIGQRVSVDGEVEHVLGPRLFMIDEPNWIDLDGEMLVFVPTPLAALVREDDRITISGTVKPFVRAEVEREWGWLGLDPEIEVEFTKKPILVASRVVGGDNKSVMIVDVKEAGDRPVGTSGSSSATTLISDLAAIENGDEDLVGRRVTIKGANVSGVAQGGGFFVKSASGGHVFVLPSDQDRSTVRTGEAVTLNGVILEMPQHMEDRLKGPGRFNDNIYVYATGATK